MITKEEVQHIAGLARIGVDEKDLDKFAADLSAVLDWIEELKEVEVEGVEPTAHITGMENRMREDAQIDFENKNAIVDLFPEKKDNYGKVKSVL
ncbi:MAG: Asp-tRNA(Asn)/Glu-tRNA(Gln) amidotransferase subunit GatC [Candidatus Moranbacteria bacterium]|nr:Asp-tRNA(Asn)/Glu-tRNA(Gln) amidotransferase subunit GatC [bacterium]MDP1834018.1 Asp-tRNA(Asn)/Glu-tRNA(Gln) amidotransferase subunit GatC [Candidatus Moranbacteria bacterium]